MKVKATKNFWHPDTKRVAEGEEVNVSKQVASHLLKLELVEAIEEEKPKKTRTRKTK